MGLEPADDVYRAAGINGCFSNNYRHTIRDKRRGHLAYPHTGPLDCRVVTNHLSKLSQASYAQTLQGSSVAIVIDVLIVAIFALLHLLAAQKIILGQPVEGLNTR